MKTLFKSDELPHIFFHKQAAEGRSPGNGSFANGAFYSFATVILRRCEHKGREYYVRDHSSFSSRTGKVQNCISRSIPPGLTIFHYDKGRREQDLRPSPLDLFNHALENAAACEAKAAKARVNKSFYLEASAKWMERAAAVKEFFSLRNKLDGKTLDRLRTETAAAERKAAKELAEQRKRRAEREATETANQLERYEAWKQGVDTQYFDSRRFPVAFRVESVTGSGAPELVSTLGARVPLREAKIAYRFITSKRGQAWRENGETCPVGGYKVQSISEHGIVAGCHRIAWAEIERLAPILSEREPASPKGWETVTA